MTDHYQSIGTCIGALFVDETIRGAIADVARWDDIWQTASGVGNVCVGQHGFGGVDRGNLGEDHQSMVFVLYSPTSEANDIIGQAVVCPNCNQEGCPATLSIERCPFWNVHSSRVGAPDIPRPALPGTAPGATEYDVQAYCGVPCKSQKDCGCGDYTCMTDFTQIPRLRATSMECVFIPLSSQAYPMLGGFGLKTRGMKEKKQISRDLAQRCVCDERTWGPGCCGEDIVVVDDRIETY